MLRASFPIVLWMLCGCAPDSASRGDAPVDAAFVHTTSNEAPDAAFAAAAPDLVPPASCSYIDFATDHAVVRCAGAWVNVTRLHDANSSPSCPDVYTAGGQFFSSMAKAATALNCKTDCVYVPERATLSVRCGQKGETTRYTDGGPSQSKPVGACEQLFQADYASANGYYLASETDDFWSMHPCNSPRY